MKHSQYLALVLVTLVGCGERGETTPRATPGCSLQGSATTALTFIPLTLRDLLEDHAERVRMDSENALNWSRVQFDWETSVGPLLDFEFVARSGLMPHNVPRDLDEGFEFLSRIESTRDNLLSLAEAELATCLSASVDGAGDRCAIVSASFRHFSRKCQRHSERLGRLEGYRRMRATRAAAHELELAALALGASSTTWKQGLEAGPIAPRVPPAGPEAERDAEEERDLRQLRQISLAVKVMGALGPLGCEPVQVECAF